MIIETTLHSAWNQVETLVLVSRLQILKPASFADLSLGAAAATTRGSVFNSKHTSSTILLLTNFHKNFHKVYRLTTNQPNHKPCVKNSSSYVIGEQYTTSSKQSDMHVTNLAGADTAVEYKAYRK